MKKIIPIALLLSLLPIYSYSEQPVDNIILPAYNDLYSQLAHKAQAQDPTINFRDLRIAYLASSAQKIAGNALPELTKLRKEMFDAVTRNDDVVVRAKAEAILNIKYIDLDAHKLLRQSCGLLGDKDCEDRHRFTGLGLLRSIISTGDGKACKTAWEVVEVGEEYFVLRMIGARFQGQSVVQDSGNICDKMQGLDKNQVSTAYYFNVNRVFASYGVQ